MISTIVTSNSRKILCVWSCASRPFRKHNNSRFLGNTHSRFVCLLTQLDEIFHAEADPAPPRWYRACGMQLVFRTESALSWPRQHVHLSHDLFRFDRCPVPFRVRYCYCTESRSMERQGTGC